MINNDTDNALLRAAKRFIDIVDAIPEDRIWFNYDEKRGVLQLSKGDSYMECSFRKANEILSRGPAYDHESCEEMIAFVTNSLSHEKDGLDNLWLLWSSLEKKPEEI